MNFRVLALAVAALTSGAAFADSASQATFTQAGTISVGAQTQGTPDPIVYDSFTGGQATTTTGTPRTYEGGAFNMSAAGPQVDITSMTVYVASPPGGTFTDIQVRVQLWNTYTAAGTTVFSSPAGAPIVGSIGPQTLAANTFLAVTVPVSPAVRLNTLTNKGFAVNFKGNSGAGLVDTDNLTGLLTVNSPPAVGTSAIAAGNGFYRNASARTDFNFIPSDLRSFAAPTTDAKVAIILNGTSTTPVSLQSFDVK